MAYPGSLDSFTTKTDDVTEVMAAHVNDLQTAIVAIETELGTDPAGTKTDLKTRLIQSLSTEGNLKFAAPTTLTISSGDITITQNFHLVDTEAAGASDDLDTINGGADGMVLILRQANDARDVTVKHAIGNIYTTSGADYVLSSSKQALMLIYDNTLSVWIAFDAHAPITVTDTSTIDFTLTGQALTASVIPGGIAHNDLASKQGGTAGEYYHLTSAQVSGLHAAAHDINGADHTGTPLGVTKGGTGSSTALTQGSVVFAGASGVYSQDNANLFWDDSNNRLGVGTSTPESGYKVDVLGGSVRIRQNSGYPGFVGFAYGTGAVPIFKAGAARGTMSSPSSTRSGDILGSFQCAGYYGNFYYGNFITSAEVGFQATENWTNTARGTSLTLYTTKTGTTSEVAAFVCDGALNTFGTKAGITAEGGFFVKMTAGEALYRGEVVASIQGAGGADGKVWKCPTSGNENDMPLGVVYADASANAEVWIVTSGIAYVLPTSGVTATRGYVITASTTTAGRVDQAAKVPKAATHFKECGHFIDTGSGNGALTRAIVHFN